MLSVSSSQKQRAKQKEKNGQIRSKCEPQSILRAPLARASCCVLRAASFCELLTSFVYVICSFVARAGTRGKPPRAANEENEKRKKLFRRRPTTTTHRHLRLTNNESKGKTILFILITTVSVVTSKEKLAKWKCYVKPKSSK